MQLHLQLNARIISDPFTAHDIFHVHKEKEAALLLRSV